MASKGLRAIFYQVTQKVEAGYNPSHTTETLIGYIVCCVFVLFHFSSLCVFGQPYSLASFGLIVGSCDLPMCMDAKRRLPIRH
jgi:hypothetical protein